MVGNTIPPLGYANVSLQAGSPTQGQHRDVGGMLESLSDKMDSSRLLAGVATSPHLAVHGGQRFQPRLSDYPDHSRN